MYKTILTVSLIFGSAAFARPSVQAGDASTTEEGKRLIEDMRNALLGVGVEADALGALKQNSELSRETYLEDMTVIGENLNRAGHDLAELQAEQDRLAPWEQEAVSKAAPLMKDAADNANRAISTYKEHATQLWATRAYWDDLSIVYDDTQRAAGTLTNFLKIDKATSEEARAREHLAEDLKTK